MCEETDGQLDLWQWKMVAANLGGEGKGSRQKQFRERESTSEQGSEKESNSGGEKSQATEETPELEDLTHSTPRESQCGA